MASIEEKVEEHYKKVLDDLRIRHFGKTTANSSILITTITMLLKKPFIKIPKHMMLQEVGKDSF